MDSSLSHRAFRRGSILEYRLREYLYSSERRDSRGLRTRVISRVRNFKSCSVARFRGTHFADFEIEFRDNRALLLPGTVGFYDLLSGIFKFARTLYTLRGQIHSRREGRREGGREGKISTLASRTKIIFRNFSRTRRQLRAGVSTNLLSIKRTIPLAFVKIIDELPC